MPASTSIEDDWMIIIGIDPGQTGAIAVIRDGKVERLFDMPATARRSGKGKEVNAQLLAKIFADILETYNIAIEVVRLEKVSAMPGQGVTSMFNFGRAVGVVEGVVATYSLSLELVSPQSWKKKLGLIGKDKDATRTWALQTYPYLADRLSRKKDIGRADAIAIAITGDKGEIDVC